MALTKAQWFAKLKSWVPAWVFQRSDRNEAIFLGMAKTFEQMQGDVDAHFAETFIGSASGEFLDLHGHERSVPRLPGELDIPYRPRIRTIKNSSNCPTLKELVDSQLLNGESQFIEHGDINNFLNREAFLNRDIINTKYTYNAFTVLVDNQRRPSESFLNREDFCNRQDFIGQLESSVSFFDRIVQIINTNKAFGVFYRLIERA